MLYIYIYIYIYIYDISSLRVNSLDDEHMSARNMYRFGINIYEKRIVRRVGHLQELFIQYFRPFSWKQFNSLSCYYRDYGINL